MCRIEKNVYGAYEVYFDNKPQTAILDYLKENGFKWFFKNKCWSAFKSEEDINSIKEKINANAFIQTKTQQQNTAIDLDKIDYKALKDKYNAYCERDNDGWHGLNWLKHNYDSKAFKKTIQDILKKEFGLNARDYKLSVRLLDDKVDFSLFANTDMLLSYQELKEKLKPNEYNVIDKLYKVANTHAYDLIDNNEKLEYFYNNYIIKYNINNYMLKDKYRKMFDFIEELFESYSYNHSDLMADYFDSGVWFKTRILNTCNKNNDDIYFYDCKTFKEVQDKLAKSSV